MASPHPTFADKDRPVRLTTDGEWHPLYFKLGTASPVASVLVPDGTYIVLVALHAEVITEPISDMAVRGQRYPSKDSTGWKTISMRYRPFPKQAFGTFDFKVVVKAGSVNPEVAQRVGIDYAVRGGAVILQHRILKFLRQLD